MPRLDHVSLIPVVLLALVCTACSDTDGGDSGGESGAIDSELLAQYKLAIPSADRVEAVVPGAPADPNALTALGDAELARLAIASAWHVNAPARLVVTVLRAITAVPPTLYDSTKKEFVWGPWENDDGYGQVMAYIRENPPEDDMKYGYALVRLVDSDLATMTPVIWGVATPDPDDRDLGVGMTLWDFEATNSFDARHDPSFDPEAPKDKGRFAMLYGSERGENDDGDFAFNVAAFRDFIAKDAEPDAAPANLDYFFGHFEADDGSTFDFLDWKLTANLCEEAPDTCFEAPADGEAEVMSLRSGFIDRGMGRAEALISGGDLTGDVAVVECWDDDIDRTHMSVQSDGALVAEIGACDAPFDAALEEHGVPTMAELDQEILAGLDCLATGGLEACED